MEFNDFADGEQKLVNGALGGLSEAAQAAGLSPLDVAQMLTAACRLQTGALLLSRDPKRAFESIRDATVIMSRFQKQPQVVGYAATLVQRAMIGDPNPLRDAPAFLAGIRRALPPAEDGEEAT